MSNKSFIEMPHDGSGAMLQPMSVEIYRTGERIDGCMIRRMPSPYDSRKGPVADGARALERNQGGFPTEVQALTGKAAQDFCHDGNIQWQGDVGAFEGMVNGPGSVKAMRGIKPPTPQEMAQIKQNARCDYMYQSKINQGVAPQAAAKSITEALQLQSQGKQSPLDYVRLHSPQEEVVNRPYELTEPKKISSARFSKGVGLSAPSLHDINNPQKTAPNNNPFDQ